MKTKIQALKRAQLGLPLKRGRSRTMAYAYKRNGVKTLFAALNMLDGKVLSRSDQLHRHQDWLKFRKMIDSKTPKTKELHLDVDNYATHKHPEVKAWLAQHHAFISISHPPVLLGSTGSSGSFATLQANAFVVALSPACLNRSPPSTNISLRITPNRSRLSGQPKASVILPKVTRDRATFNMNTYN